MTASVSHLPSVGSAGEPARLLEFRPLAALKDLPAEPEWLWHGLIAAGSMTMLAGHPFAGKSMIVGGLLRAMETGERFLGRDTACSTAVLLTEEPDSALRARFETLGQLELRSEFIGRSRGALTLPWNELIDQATQRALAMEHRLLVIDTFPGLADLEEEGENDAAAVTKRLRPLQAAAGEGLAVVFLHHVNKNTGKARGSGAFTGTVDISLRLMRQGTSCAFTIKTESRFPSTPETLRGVLRQDVAPWVYDVVGGTDGSQAAAAETRHDTDERLWRAVVEAGARGLTYAEVNRIAGLSSHQAKKRFPSWLDESKLARTGSGTKNDPHRWFVAGSADSVQCGATERGGDCTETL